MIKPLSSASGLELAGAGEDSWPGSGDLGRTDRLRLCDCVSLRDSAAAALRCFSVAGMLGKLSVSEIIVRGELALGVGSNSGVLAVDGYGERWHLSSISCK